MKPITRKVKFGAKAARVTLEGDWTGLYSVETQGRSEVEIAADINRWQLHHEKKSARLSGFADSITGTSVKVQGKVYDITDCTLRERGRDVELYLSVRDAEGNRLASMPKRLIYATVDDVPDNDAIIDMITVAITKELANMAAEKSKISRLKLQFGDTD